MDIVQRVCKAQNYSPPEEEEVEIFSSGSSKEYICEEEHVSVDEEKQLDLAILQKELDCMKRRIQVLQLKLKMMQMAECPDEECVDFEVELDCSTNKEICNLQKGQHKLQCQVTELVRCCKFAKEQIGDLRSRLCQKSREILQLQKVVATLDAWKNTLQHEFGKCIERFECLKHVKAEWSDVEAKLDEQKKTYSDLEKKFISKYCFMREKLKFMSEISDLRQMFKGFFETQVEKFYKLELRLQANGCLMSQAPHGETPFDISQDWHTSTTESRKH